MSDPGTAHDRLRAANPAPTVTVVDRPDAATFLATLETTEAPPARRAPFGPLPRRALAVAAAAFVATLLLGVGLWLASLLSPEDDVVEPTPPTTIATTTVAPPSTTSTTTSQAPSTTAPPAISAEEQARLDRFEAAYNAGDPDALLALLQPDVTRELISASAGRQVYTRDDIVEILETDTALHTEIALDCELIGDLFSCTTSRYDDIHRVLGIPATADEVWNLRFDEAGLVRGWNINADSGDDRATGFTGSYWRPFILWALENHPEAGELRAGAQTEWVAEKRETIVALVAEWAAGLGVTLEE